MRFFIALFFSTQILNAQKDSTIAVPMIGMYYSLQLPQADLSERFGFNNCAGINFMYKTNTNWIVGFEANYMFGNNVKIDPLLQLRTPEGTVTDNEGYPANVRVTERGLGLHFIGGKVFPIFGSNANSGLMITIGAGYLQHRINLYDVNQKIAALKDNLRFGYDHLTVGFSLSQFVGYLHMSKNRLSNFYVGVEFYEAFTKSLRQLNYNSALPDTERRLDVLTGFRVGWVLPLYKRMANDFYYN